MKIILTILSVICVLGWLAFIPLWPKQVKLGTIKIDTYQKIQVMLGLLMID